MEKRIQGGSKADPSKIMKNSRLCVKTVSAPPLIIILIKRWGAAFWDSSIRGGWLNFQAMHVQGATFEMSTRPRFGLNQTESGPPLTSS